MFSEGNVALADGANDVVFEMGLELLDSGYQFAKLLLLHVFT